MRSVGSTTKTRLAISGRGLVSGLLATPLLSTTICQYVKRWDSTPDAFKIAMRDSFPIRRRKKLQSMIARSDTARFQGVWYAVSSASFEQHGASRAVIHEGNREAWVFREALPCCQSSAAETHLTRVLYRQCINIASENS